MALFSNMTTACAMKLKMGTFHGLFIAASDLNWGSKVTSTYHNKHRKKRTALPTLPDVLVYKYFPTPQYQLDKVIW
jgi:hypothetical protein